MYRILKTLLLWLLMAALPIQGAAAAIESSCGPSHHHAAAMPDAAAAHHHDHHDDGMAHGHDADGAAMGALNADTSAHVQADDGNAPSAQHKASSCSACAACCVGAAAPPSASLPAPAYGSSESVAITPTPLFTGFIPASLERPPKRISA